MIVVLVYLVNTTVLQVLYTRVETGPDDPYAYDDLDVTQIKT